MLAGVTLGSFSAHDTFVHIGGAELHIARRSDVAHVAKKLDALWSAPIGFGFEVKSDASPVPVSFIRESNGVIVRQGTTRTTIDDTALVLLSKQLSKLARSR
ncbi:hypothetical protein GCM10011390_51150 [Aureimonas endophytica]|uniref:Uncharacterized protein n=1 Tax=Aureimonas endophytica TaxID=2027858 RepID=A0A917A3U2_9HYPH|nr:hypothetical protein [Aureimonas endophytica]GGE25478.1 hypothetical protein GCM10011390_51150 [Aureimonas endophytica]